MGFTARGGAAGAARRRGGARERERERERERARGVFGFAASARALSAPSCGEGRFPGGPTWRPRAGVGGDPVIGQEGPGGGRVLLEGFRGGRRARGAG